MEPDENLIQRAPEIVKAMRDCEIKECAKCEYSNEEDDCTLVDVAVNLIKALLHEREAVLLDREQKEELSCGNKLLTEEQFRKLYELTGGFNDEKLPHSSPVRPECESFGEFVLKGGETLIRESPELV